MYPRSTSIRLAVALSIVLHLGVLWPWAPWLRDPFRILSPDADEFKEGGNRLMVRIAPISPPEPPPQPEARARAKPAPRKPAAPPAPRSAPSPSPPPSAASPALTRDAIERSAPPREVASAPASAPTPAEPPRPAPSASAAPAMDMAAMLEARRRARGESPPVMMASNDEEARKNRIVAENLGTLRGPAFGFDPRSGGGIFQIETLYLDSAEFIFFGWNKEIRRNTRQKIEVRRGNNPDIRIAVVRKMIDIIRDHEQGDFRWDSSRLKRSLTLSARQRDQSGLEDFLMAEFFGPDAR